MRGAEYRPDHREFTKFMNSQNVGNAMGRVAAEVAAQANAEGRSTYDSRQRTVQGGWRATDRAGAEVIDLQVRKHPLQKSIDGHPSRVLARISSQFRIRGGA